MGPKALTAQLPRKEEGTGICCFYCTVNSMALKTHNKITLGKAGELCPSPGTHGCSHRAPPLTGTAPSTLKSARGAGQDQWGCSSWGGSSPCSETPGAPTEEFSPVIPAPAALLGVLSPGFAAAAPQPNPAQAPPIRDKARSAQQSLTRCRRLLQSAQLTKKQQKMCVLQLPSSPIPAPELAGQNTTSQGIHSAHDAQGDLGRALLSNPLF